MRLRRRLKIAIGDAGNQLMLRAIRVHANFAEYVPLSLILIFLVESQGANALLVHALGIALLAGRASHAFGVSQTNENYRFRSFGIVMTLATILACSMYLLYSYTQKISA